MSIRTHVVCVFIHGKKGDWGLQSRRRDATVAHLTPSTPQRMSRTLAQAGVQRRDCNGLLLRAAQATRTADETRRGSTWRIQQSERVIRHIMFVGLSALHDTLSMELLTLIPIGSPKEFRAASHRPDRQEIETLIANLPATPWIRGQPPPRGNSSGTKPVASTQRTHHRKAETRRCTTNYAQDVAVDGGQCLFC